MESDHFVDCILGGSPTLIWLSSNIFDGSLNYGHTHLSIEISKKKFIDLPKKLPVIITNS